MSVGMHMKHIARIQTDFPTKFGIPRQSGLVEEVKGRIIFEKEYRVREAFRGLEDYSHIWLLWEFSESKQKKIEDKAEHTDATKLSWSPTVRPPKLGGNERVGVFATRSPFRPNPIGLSCVKLEKIEFTKDDGPVLYVAGADLMDGTPIYDIKPYLTYADSRTEATGGFTTRTESGVQEILIEETLLGKIPEDKREALVKVLMQDPRPGYQKVSDRIYGFEYGHMEVKFTVRDGVLEIVDVIKM